MWLLMYRREAIQCRIVKLRLMQKVNQLIFWGKARKLTILILLNQKMMKGNKSQINRPGRDLWLYSSLMKVSSMMTWIWSKGRRRVDRKVIFNRKYTESNLSISIIQVSLSLNRGWSLERRAKLSIPSLELIKILMKMWMRSILLEKAPYRPIIKTNPSSREVIFQSKLERIALTANILLLKDRQPKKIILFLDSIQGQVKLKTWKNW